MDPEIISELFPLLLQGLWILVQLTFWAAIVALGVGLAIAIGLRVAPSYIRIPLFWFAEFIRNTPLLVQAVFAWFFVLTTPIAQNASPFWVGVGVLGLHYACYCAEAYRAGIDGISAGQWEAITAISLPKPRAWSDILIPQMMRRCTPALGNYMIAMLKEVPILSAIGVLEMIRQVQNYVSANFSGGVEGYTLAGLMFLAVSYPLAVAMRKLEIRLARAHG